MQISVAHARERPADFRQNAQKKPLPSAVVKHWGVFSEFDSVG